jgi:hypothetical protein
MLVGGITSLVWPLLRIGPNHPEFLAKNLAYKVGARTRVLAFAVAYIVAGVGLFWQHAWARKLALGLLVIGTLYTANAFAWGFSNGPSTPRVRLFSRIFVAAWNGLWFYLIYRLVL